MLFLLHEIVRFVLREAARKRAMRHLTARLATMTDRRLDDIAVTRGDIAALAQRAYPHSSMERMPAPRFTLEALPIAG